MPLPTIPGFNLPQVQTGLKVPLNLNGYGISSAPATNTSTQTSSNPSATSVLKTPAAQKYTASLSSGITDPSKYYGNATGTPTFDSTGKALSVQNSSSPTQNNLGSTQPLSAPDTPQVPDAAQQALSKYLASLSDTSAVSNASTAYNDYIANQSKSVSGLSGRGMDIPLSIVRGEQQKLLDQTNPEATRLQNAIGIAQTGQNSTQSAAKAAYDAATGADKVKSDAAQTAFDNANKTASLKVQQDSLNKPISVGEGNTIFDPVTGKAIYTAPKLAAPSTILDSGSYVAGTNPTVDSWVQNINSGRAKLSDITGNPSLKGLVSQGLSQTQGSSNDILTTTKKSLDELNNLVDTNQGFSGAVGAKGISSLFGVRGIPLAGTKAANFSAKLNQVKNDVILPNLNLLHGLGRITDREFQALSSAITSLSTDLPEADFKTELANITDSINQKIQNTPATNGNRNQPQNIVTAPDGQQIIITD